MRYGDRRAKGMPVGSGGHRGRLQVGDLRAHEEWRRPMVNGGSQQHYGTEVLLAQQSDDRPVRLTARCLSGINPDTPLASGPGHADRAATRAGRCFRLFAQPALSPDAAPPVALVSRAWPGEPGIVVQAGRPGDCLDRWMPARVATRAGRAGSRWTRSRRVPDDRRARSLASSSIDLAVTSVQNSMSGSAPSNDLSIASGGS